MTTTVDRLRRELGELLERHERARDLDEFSAYAADPVGFIRDVLGGEPWSAQEELAEAVRGEPLTVVRSCNSAGKDWMAARLALWWTYCRRGLVLLTGPTERQVREIVMTEVRTAFAKAKLLPGELFERALRVDREGRIGILAFTSTEASKLTGFHAPRVLAIVTEAQGSRGLDVRGAPSVRYRRGGSHPGRRQPPLSLRAVLHGLEGEQLAEHLVEARHLAARREGH